MQDLLELDLKPGHSAALTCASLSDRSASWRAVRASSDLELTAVCTTKADSAEAARRAWGARLAFDDYRKMIASPAA